MKSKKIHRFLAMVLLLPLVGWMVTGLVFLVKPGYTGAYEQLAPKFYPLGERVIIAKPEWMQVRMLKTVLGTHLLVYSNDSWLHLNPNNLMPMPEPSATDAKRLLLDAISHNPKRYGTVQSVTEGAYITSTGVELRLDWNTLSIHQKGYDTALINTLYKIHYLQWFGNKQANIAFGVLGLSGLFLLVFYGGLLLLRGRENH